MPKISVLLPAYNAERTIEPAVASILSQTEGDFELIVLEDGSRDKTLTLLQAMNDPRIKIIHDGQNKGLTAQLNQGVALATGDYIARMDADDIAFPTRFQKQVAFLDVHRDIDLLATRAVVFRKDGVLGLLPYAETHEQLTRFPWAAIHMPHPTWMGRAAWFRAHPYRDIARAEDQDLLLRSVPESRYACLPDVLLAYRQGDFDFRKTWLARKSLLNARIEIFAARGQYLNIVLAAMLFVTKVVLDAFAAVPGCDRVFFWRMSGGRVTSEAEQFLKNLPVS